MKDKIINEIASNMVNILNNEQLGKLKDALEYSLHNCDIVQTTNEMEIINNDKYLELFITSFFKLEELITGCATPLAIENKFLFFKSYDNHLQSTS